ncbi:hypothetical protein CABS01_11781 [Colletotrichum abscissum]|uniref:Uncharacterized protein n=1 Tax=Colletotrichum abscissum TaxID=1671311 RepID=A0A9Q0B0J6_9PEZI|nr:uncharacterized protein CABS01_11781 [Colletotrichum abscissum]KAI3545119.1 hypothetical protein CABS02_09462 [Colletotrichum abscissum]KAK1492884.1 hypothetical protein CABS01_11781 [Colletotrichum abscissum]
MLPCDLDDCDFEAPNVIAVREDEGQSPEVIEQSFRLRIRYASPGLVSFRLLVVPDGMSTKTTSWLQIRADCIELLEKMLYDKANTSGPSPPYLETVRLRLNGMQSVARMQFHLHKDGRIDLVTPNDSDSGNTTDGEPVLDTRALLKSLATASRFSVFFRHDILRRKTFLKYKRAIQDFPSLSENDKLAYECMVDVRRLYHGAGGKVHTSRGLRGSCPPTEAHCSSPDPTTPASCGGSTVPFDDVPADRGLPPPYDECSSEGQSPETRPGPAATVAEKSKRDCERDPPEYGDTGRQKNALELSLDVFPLGSADVYTPGIKRKRSPTTVCTTKTSMIDAPRPGQLQSPLLADRGSPLMRALEQQQQHIHDLQQMFRKSQKRNEALEARCDELEKRLCELEEGQSENVETVGNLDITLDELQARCDNLEKQVPDVCDEMEDLKKTWLEECREELEDKERESFEDRMAKQVRESVEAELNKVRRRVLKALQPP